MFEFTGKVAVITGAASGFGRAFADKGAALGMKLVLADVNPEALARGTVFVQCATASCAVWHKIADAHNFYGTEYTGLQQSGGDGGAGA